MDPREAAWGYKRTKKPLRHKKTPIPADMAFIGEKSVLKNKNFLPFKWVPISPLDVIFQLEEVIQIFAMHYFNLLGQ